MATAEIRETGQYRLWDLVVGVLALALIVFLMITMGIRSDEAARIALCHERLTALSQAQQSYLVKNGKYAEKLWDLGPFLDEEHSEMSFRCPITGKPFEMAVQANKYIVLAPYTGYSINTGDTSW